MIDLLGVQPAPLSGARFSLYDQAAEDRATAASDAVKKIWIDHPPQDAIIARILALVERGRHSQGGPLPGLRLSQDSQAGKSRTLERCSTVLAGRRAAMGLPPNPHEFLIIGLDQKINLKSVYQDILIQMGDPHWQNGSEKVLCQRIDEFCRRLGVAGIAIDEVQHLRRSANAVTDVTDALKRLLDKGIVTLVLVGDMDSKALFESNIALAARLGRPLELTPLDQRVGSQAAEFKSFCKRYDAALVATGAVAKSAELTRLETLRSLYAVSGGHVGRVARLLQEALEHAAWRGADTVEPYDLSHAVRNFAMPMWIDYDPFSEGAVKSGRKRLTSPIGA